MVQRFRFPLVLSIIFMILLSACEKPLHDPSEQAPLLVPEATQVLLQEPDSSAPITLPEPEPTLVPIVEPEPTSLPAPSADNNAADEAYPAPAESVIIDLPTATPITLPAAQDPTATPIVIPAPQTEITTVPVATIDFSQAPTQIPAPALATLAFPTPNPTWVFEQTRDAQNNNNFTAQPVPTSRTHTVVGGDTVFALSQIYSVSADAIAQANFLSNFFIFPGQELIIPAIDSSFSGGTTSGTGDIAHTVLAGQTLYSIATSYGVTVEQVTAYNGLLDPTLLSVGQVLFIPR